MFLDDQLYEWTKLRDIEEVEDVYELVKELHTMCSDWYKTKLDTASSVRDIAVVLDKTFRFWDMFIEKLKKENHDMVPLLTTDGISIRDVVLSSERIRLIYEQGMKAKRCCGEETKYYSKKRPTDERERKATS